MKADGNEQHASVRRSQLERVVSLVGRIGADPDDSEDIRLRKSLFLSAVLFLAIPSGVAQGLIGLAYQEQLAGAFQIGFAVLSLCIVILLALAPRWYRILLFCELGLVLIAPFLTMVALGGFVNLNLVIMWSFMAPLGALVMADRTSAGRWFIAYLALLGLLVALQPHLRTGNNLPPVVALANGMVALSGTAISTFFLLNYFVAQRNLFQEKADNLLLNILPEEIAAILKEENRTIAEHYDGVSVLFADVVGFTPMSAEMTPIELVELLNEVFSHFDSLVGKYGLEKIKTIGDCYMVASGVPRPRPDHAQALTSLALDIRDYASEHEIKGRRIAFRIGINSGSVVAGVIGRRKFIYDLWGDAVNTASRMESHGAGGAVQITESTYELIKHDFACETRGILKVKGKGDMKVWHILGRKGQTLPDGTAAVT